MGTLSEYLKIKILNRIKKESKTRKLTSKFIENISVEFFNHQAGKSNDSEEKKPLFEGYTIGDLNRGPLGAAEHLKLKRSKHKNVKFSQNCERNVELLLNLHFKDEKSFRDLKELLYNKDFIGLDTKKYFLKDFINTETTKHIKLFESELVPKLLSPREFSNPFRRSIEKNDISQMMKGQYMERSVEEVSCSHNFQFNDTNKLMSNLILPESNFILLNDSNKNSLGFLQRNESQFLSGMGGKNTPGNFELQEKMLNSRNLMQNNILNFGFNDKRFEQNSGLYFSPPKKSQKLELTPIKLKMEDHESSRNRYRDLKSNPILKKHMPSNQNLSNLIYLNENQSKGFELTRKFEEKESSLGKRNHIQANLDLKNSANDTPIYDFKNVTKKIYGIDNLNRLKKKNKKKMEINMVDESRDLLITDREECSKKENKIK